MEAYIRYKRIHKYVTEEELDELFKEIVSNGDEIISYKEGEYIGMQSGLSRTEGLTMKLPVTIITGKRQNRTL